MKIHENQNNSYRSKSTCGYCRETGHNQYQCPHVKGDWENFLSRLEIPKDILGHPIKRGYNRVTWNYNNNKAFNPLTDGIENNALASWFRNCRKAYLVQRERGFDLEGKAKRKVTAKRTCGFCGSEHHTRRNCDVMEEFLKDCYKANENWRRACYKELVEIHGLSVGACVKVGVSTGWNSPPEEKIGLITKINWDTVNVLSGMSNRSDFAESSLDVHVMVGNETMLLKDLNETFNTIGKNGTSYRWSGAKLLEVITHSPTPLPPEWITSYKESFGTLVKKRTYAQLQSGMKSEWNAPNIVAQIKAWK